MKPSVAIIGAGYAGLSAGVALAESGVAVSIFETSRVLGGRARGVMFGDDCVDNGQHIMIGAYSETLSLLKKLGVPEASVLSRRPLHLRYPEFELRAPRLPAPLHMAAALLTSKGLRWRDRWLAIRFMQALKQQSFKLPADITAAELLQQHQQSAQLCRYLWDPLCISALNTASHLSSAQVFANVLRDSLAGDRAASDLLFPRTDLSTLLPEHAARHIKALGGEVHTQSAIRSIRKSEQGFVLNDDDTQRFDAVILAVAPYHAARLLPESPLLASLQQQLQSLSWEPITTIYLRYPTSAQLPVPMLGLSGGHAHWVFDRGQLCHQAGIFAAVISAAHASLPAEALANAVDAELRAALSTLSPGMALPALREHLVITEKRATFACVPNLSRPMNQTAVAGFFIAGDYTASDYPATIESAVRSGRDAATALLASLRPQH